jgi:CDP-diacylglycerol--serine O-phosphatidyltransferase
MRLARFNIQSAAQLDKRYFVGLPSPAAAGVIAATVYAWPDPTRSSLLVLAAVAVVLVPAALMVSTIRFRSVKAIAFGWMPSYMPLFLFALFIAFISMEPRITLAIVAYAYLLAGVIGLAVTRWRYRREGAPPAASP